MTHSTQPISPRTGGRVFRIAVTLAAALAVSLAASAQPPGMAGGMPNAKQMSGIPMPMNDVPAGSVMVRVVRDEMSNTLPNITVQIEVDGRVLTAKTDAEGLAKFPGLAVGASVHATATVGTEKLDSQPFTVPPGQGVRLLLVTGAGAGGADAPLLPAPPVAGAGPISFGGQSRIQIEMNDDAVEVFYILEVVNRTAGPINTPAEIVFQLPEGATQGSTLEGSSTQAQVRGNTVSISGPFAPGTTPVQLAFTLPPAGSGRSIRQSFPVPVDQVQVLVARTGDLQISSPQFSNNGNTGNGAGAFLIGNGPGVAAGTEITLALSGLPTRPTAWRRVAIGLVVIILLVGTWATFSARPGDALAARRKELETRRERLLGELVRLEEHRRSGSMSEAKYTLRRADLTAQLERIYGELDKRGGVTAGDQGLVA
jgi:hypothetical protein